MYATASSVKHTRPVALNVSASGRGVRGEQTRGVGVGGSAGRARRLGDARGGCELSRKWRGAGEEAGLKGRGVRQPVSSYFASELSIKKLTYQHTTHQNQKVF